MSKPFEPLLAFQLAGTVSIPSCFPTAGRIMLAKIIDQDGTPQSAVDLLRIEHKLSQRVMIARTIRFEDVRAIWLADVEDNPRAMRDVWLMAGDSQVRKIHKVLRSAGHDPHEESKAGRASAKPGSLVGSVFVAESSMVLMDVAVGMTAAESAEYYPPLVRDRSDGHYMFRDCT